ncbi:hypothetical protein KEN51_CDS0414 [Pseudomonas phage vB_Pae10145-KEN51]|nr:hypothetical protein [Pseudomonas phage ANB1]WNV50420.1 hypothetical protein [Pseudomonas phage PhiPizzaParty]WRQ05853.1 hypothetical protein IPCDMZAV_CDS0330 [Pseudomonas phage 6B]WRQ05940.1 hypothetical protein QAMIJHJT_CDS0008 [Pseudomonas phage 9-Ps-8B]WRQ06348.1 hypothetical protein FOPPYZMZ_CDS0007 [Pseudomonas phage 9Ps-7B]WRQ07109.1 hypothetical protein ZBUARNPM_CDS0360 [Pseudomonas phage 14Ps5-6]
MSRLSVLTKKAKAYRLPSGRLYVVKNYAKK